jgi:hypothetical protein
LRCGNDRRIAIAVRIRSFLDICPAPISPRAGDYVRQLDAVSQPANKMFRLLQGKVFHGSPNKRRAAVFTHGQNAGVAMQYRNEIVPLAVMGSLSAAIMLVFAVTMMH